MGIRYIIVADGGEGAVYKRNSMQNKLDLIKNFFSEESHKHGRDLDSDRPGRTSDRVGEGHHIFESRITSHEKAKSQFIRNIVDEVNEYYKHSDFDELIVIAPPKALGAFREEFSKHAHQVPIARTIEKDLTKYSSQEIINHLDG